MTWSRKFVEEEDMGCGGYWVLEKTSKSYYGTTIIQQKVVKTGLLLE